MTFEYFLCGVIVRVQNHASLLSLHVTADLKQDKTSFSEEIKLTLAMHSNCGV